MRDLEFIRGSRQSPGSPGNDVAARCSEPPFPTHGGQDDGSSTNSLKLVFFAFSSPHILIQDFRFIVVLIVLGACRFSFV